MASSTTPDTHYLAEDKLIEAMHGRSMIGKWDILVSYKAEQLSDLLAKVWKKDQKTDAIRAAEPTPAFGRRMVYDLTLGTPKLRFDSVDNGCVAALTIPLGGKMTVELYVENDDGSYPKDPYKHTDTTIPADQYELKAKVPVKGITGDVTADQIDTRVQGAGKLIVLGQNEQAHIILHFSSETAIFSIEPKIPVKDGEKPAPVAKALTDGLTVIRDWFSDRNNVNAIDYRIATVKAIQDSTDNMALLKPKSFIFASNGDVLCIYIQTEGSGAEPGDTEAKFTNKDGSTIRPIPTGYNSSIIISHRLLHEKVLLAQLQKYEDDQKFTDKAKTVTTSDNAKGFTYEFFLKGDFTIKMRGENGVFAQVSIPNIDVHLSDEKTTLKIEDNKATFSFEKSYEVKWSESAMSFGAAMPSEYVADLVIALNQTDIWAFLRRAKTSDVATFSNNSSINMDITIKKDSFSLKAREKKGNLYTGVKNASIEFKEITLKSPNFNFIAAESVLAPGVAMVTVSKLLMPYDLMLVGDLVKEAKV